MFCTCFTNFTIRLFMKNFYTTCFRKITLCVSSLCMLARKHYVFYQGHEITESNFNNWISYSWKIVFVDIFIDIQKNLIKWFFKIISSDSYKILRLKFQCWTFLIVWEVFLKEIRSKVTWKYFLLLFAKLKIVLKLRDKVYT